MFFQRDKDVNQKISFLLDILIVLAGLLVVGLSIYWLFPVLKVVMVWLPKLFLPFILAVAGAVLLEPFINFFELRWHMRRTPAVFLGLVLSLGVVVLMITLVFSIVSSQIMEISRIMIADSEFRIAEIINFLDTLWAHVTGTASSPQMQEEVQVLIQQNLDTLKQVLSGTASFLTGALAMLPESLLFIAVMGIASFFILKDRYLIRTFILGVLPEKSRSRIRDVLGQLLNTFVRFIRAYGILILCTMLITMAGLWLFNVPFAFSAGVLAGFLDIMPVVGPGLLFLPWGILAIIFNQTQMGISVFVVYLITSLARHILEPKILGGSIGLHPLVSLMALYMGLKVAGLWGMILFPMTLAIIVTLFRVGVLHKPNWEKTDKDGDEQA